MSSGSQGEEVRWQVIKAMLDEFPALKMRVKEYLGDQSKKKQEKP